MSKALPITKRQAQALFRAAEAELGVAEVRLPQGVVVRLVPRSLVPDDKQVDDEDDIRL